MMTHIDTLEAAALLSGLLVAGWGFYSGWLPAWMRSQIGFDDVTEKIGKIEDHLGDMKDNHEEAMGEMETIKAGQVAIAESVANDHDVNAEALRGRHFGDSDQPTDFLRRAAQDSDE